MTAISPSRRKSVQIGPTLSPELFDKNLPPSTPLKKGATPRRPTRLSNTFVPPASADRGQAPANVKAAADQVDLISFEDLGAPMSLADELAEAMQTTATPIGTASANSATPARAIATQASTSAPRSSKSTVATAATTPNEATSVGAPPSSRVSRTPKAVTSSPFVSASGKSSAGRAFTKQLNADTSLSLIELSPAPTKALSNPVTPASIAHTILASDPALTVSAVASAFSSAKKMKESKPSNSQLATPSGTATMTPVVATPKIPASVASITTPMNTITVTSTPQATVTPAAKAVSSKRNTPTPKHTASSTPIKVATPKTPAAQAFEIDIVDEGDAASIVPIATPSHASSKKTKTPSLNSKIAKCTDEEDAVKAETRASGKEILDANEVCTPSKSNTSLASLSAGITSAAVTPVAPFSATSRRLLAPSSVASSRSAFRSTAPNTPFSTKKTDQTTFKLSQRLATPMRLEIQRGTHLRTTKKKMNEALQNDIKQGISLKSKPKLLEQVAEAIRAKPSLNATKKKLMTPIRTAIQRGTELRPTKKVMDIAIQNDIKQGVTLKSKPKLPGDLADAIKAGKKLRVANPTDAPNNSSFVATSAKKLATPVRKEIEAKKALRPTLRKQDTPLRRAIQEGVALRPTKRALPEPLLEEIRKGRELKQKPTIRKSLGEAIIKGISLKAVKRKLATPLRKAIQEGTKLRTSLRKIDTPLRKQLTAPHNLRHVEPKDKEETAIRSNISTMFANERVQIKARRRAKYVADLAVALDVGFPSPPRNIRASTPLRDKIYTAFSRTVSRYICK